VKITHELHTLIRSRYPVVGVETHEEHRLEKILGEVSERLEVPLWTWDSVEGLVHTGTSNAMYNTGRPDQVLGYLQRSAEDGLYLLKDLHHHLDDPALQRALKNASDHFRQDRRCIFLSAPSLRVPPELEKTVMVIPLALPDRDEIKQAVYRTVTGLEGGRRVKVDITRDDLDRLVDALRGLTLEEIEHTVVQAVLDDRTLSRGDIRRVLESKRRVLMKEGVLEYIPAEVDLDAVAGLDALKRWLGRRRDAFSEKAREFGLQPPRGILLVGVQGCGKSLCAKATARSWGLPLLKLDPGTLYDKYVGESEKRLGRGIRQAEAMAPAVLWIDEIEKGLASGSADQDGGLSRRLLATFLNWLQEKQQPVFVVATANDISALPPELVRKGRFDEIFFIDLPSPETRRQIFAIHLAARRRDPAGFDLEELAAASAGFSGAEIEQAVVGALYSAFSDRGPLTTDHVLEELTATRPLSVTMSEKVEALRSWASGRTVPAA